MKTKLILSCALFVLMQLPLAAQKYAPHEQWPFLNEDFAPGEILLINGERDVLDSLNIEVTGGRVCFYRDGDLLAAAKPVAAARIGGEDYLLAQGRLMKVLRRTARGAVLLDSWVDREAMSRSDVGYGFKSSVSSTEKRDIFEGGNGATLSLRTVQPPLGGAKPLKNGGEELIVKQTKYVFVKGLCLERAVKSDIKKLPWIDSGKLSSFWKQNKVKYTDDDSLAALVEFLADEGSRGE